MQSEENIMLINELKDQLSGEEHVQVLDQYKELMTKYSCAIKEIRTKFEVLNEELQIKNKRNPIHAIYSRIKTIQSIRDKLNRKNLEFSFDNIQDEIHDVAGIRVICPFVDDIYEIADMILKQDDIKLVNYKDYIRAPKPNGYRSYHMIVEIPVFFSEHKEHEMRYKKDLTEEISQSISAQLLDCATTITEMDSKMQDIKNQIYPKYPESAM